MRRIHRAGAIAALTLSLVVGLASPALATPASASNWHVDVYTSSGNTLSQASAAKTADALATFQFTTAANTALLINTQGSQKGSLLGDLAGKTVTATFTINGSGDPFICYGGCGPSPASARLFFETSSAGGFDATHYWWSNPGGTTELANGSFTLTAKVSPDQWSDEDGHEGSFSASARAGFAAAAANVTGIGLSFGGGGFFENGVGAPDSTLTLTSFTVS